MKINQEMTIREWVEQDLDRCAWEILAFAFEIIRSGTYQKNGCPILNQTTFEILREYGHTPPAWLSEIDEILNKHQKEGYERPVQLIAPWEGC